MLDSETPEAVIEEEKPIEAEAPQAVEAEEPEELVITVQGEEPEPDEDAEAEAELGDKGKRALQRAREAAKAAAAEAREVKARLAEIEARNKPAEIEVKRPTLEECGFNEEAFASQMGEYLQAKAKLDAQRAEQEAAAKAEEERYKAKLDAYHAARTKVGVDDDAQDRVVSKLTQQQQSILMKVAIDPAMVVAALAASPKSLAALAGEKDYLMFAAEMRDFERKIKVERKAPPPPESKLRGGGAAAGAVVSESDLTKLLAKAEESGDYSAYLAAKRSRKAAGVKS